MSTGRRRRWLRGLAALAGLLGALGGVPLGLIAVGQGPPGGMVSWHELVTGLSRPVSDATLLRGAGLLCWLLWACFAMAVIIEIASYLIAAERTRPRWTVPGLQTWARTLVLTAALLLPQRNVAMATGAGHQAMAPVLQPAPAPRPSAAPQQRYVVRRYDSPWAIAERCLGDGTRWREIHDAAGRPLDNGRRRHGGGLARVIHPGEVLLLPPNAGASLRSTLASAQTPVPAAPAPVQASAAPAPAPAPAAPVPVPVPAPAPAPMVPAVAPVPAAPAPAAATPGPSPEPSKPAPAPATSNRPTPPGGPTSPATTAHMMADHRSRPSTASGLLEAGLVGAAALGVIAVLRQRQAQRRPFGRRIHLPDPDLARSELSLRAAEAPERAVLIGRALDFLLELLRRAPFPPPTIFGVVADANMVEVLLDRPAAPPSPWTASAEGFRWRILATDLGAVGPPSESSAPLPALTSLGRAATGTGDVLINLEAAGVVGIAGSREGAAGLLQAMATHLCGAPWATAVNVILVGFPPALMPVESVRTAASVTEVATELRATAEIMTALIARNECADAFQARVRGLAGDGWPPVVVLCAEPPTPDELAILSGVARPGSGVAAVVTHAGAVSRWEIDVDARPMPVDALRLAVEPTVLDHADMANIGQLVSIANDDSGSTLTDPPYDNIQLSVELTEVIPAKPTVSEPASSRPDGEVSLSERLARIGSSAREDADGQLPAMVEPEVLVRILGSVEVTGAHDFKRAKARELVVYLAMHPHGVGEAELDEALWGCHTGRSVSAATRDSTVSAARSAIGGPDRLLPAQGQGREKRYQLGSAVGSDWSQFCILHRWGRDRRSTSALRRALELVRGRPFEAVVSGRTYGWVHTEGHGRHIEAEVADAADLAAGLYLEGGDPLRARWAARRGLLADPFTERLWVRLMEASDRLGESQEVERIMDEMDVMLELAGDFSGLHPNTLAAYDRLSRRHRIPTHDDGSARRT